MGKLILVTGGARSGKSAFAESLLLEKTTTYIATAEQAKDAEMLERIRLHQARRPEHWQTRETFSDLPQVVAELSSEQAVLIDCVTMQLTNIIFDRLKTRFNHDFEQIDSFLETMSVAEQANYEQQFIAEWQAVCLAAKARAQAVVVVTNEIGLGLVPETRFSRWFRDCLGKLNQLIAKEAEEVYFVISGIPQKIK